MKVNVYVPEQLNNAEQVLEGTGDTDAEVRCIASAEAVARGSIQAVRQVYGVRENSRSNWPEGE